MSMKRTCPISNFSSEEDSDMADYSCPWALVRRRFSQSALLGKIECSLRQRGHLELDLGELVGGLANFAQEGQPARVGVDFVEQIFRYDFGEPPVLVCDRF